ncbi:FecR family protein [Sulfurimonas sp.]
MKYIVLVFLLLLATVGAQEIAIVKSFQGDVVIKNSNKIMKISQGMSLSENSIIMTKSNAFISIIFKDNSVLDLGQNSVLNLKTFEFKPDEKKYDFKLFLKKGSVIFESGDISKLAPEAFELQTPQGIVAIRGTKFAVKVQ